MKGRGWEEKRKGVGRKGKGWAEEKRGEGKGGKGRKGKEGGKGREGWEEEGGVGRGKGRARGAFRQIKIYDYTPVFMAANLYLVLGYIAIMLLLLRY